MIDAAEGHAFFTKSGLPKDVLAQIWEMADATKAGARAANSRGPGGPTGPLGTP